MKSISSILNLIPIQPDKYDVDQVLEFAMQALDAIGVDQLYTDMTVFDSYTNYKYKLPTDFKTLDFILICRDTKIDYENLEDNKWEYVEEVSRPLEYERHIDECRDNDYCSPRFKITNDGYIYFSEESASIILTYKSYSTTPKGDILIPDDFDLQNAIAAYCTMKLCAFMMFNHEQNMTQLHQRYLLIWEQLYNKVRSKYVIKSIEPEALTYWSERYLKTVNANTFINRFKSRMIIP
jgi:hypothetical protein